MGEAKGRPTDPWSRLAELKEKVERAAELIAQLREDNYTLTGEVADLRRRVVTVGGARGAADAPAAESARVHEELQLLRDERKIIRAKVQSLLERIEKIDL